MKRAVVGKYRPTSCSSFENWTFNVHENTIDSSLRRRASSTSPSTPDRAALQNLPMKRNLTVPPLVMPTVPSADLGSVREVAKMLVAAENPDVPSSWLFWPTPGPASSN